MARPYIPRPEYDVDRDFIGYGEHPINPRWPNNAKIAVSFVVNYEEGGERSIMHGDGQSEPNLKENPTAPAKINSRHLPGESEFEYGSRVGFWRIFRLFNKHGMKFTLYAVSQAVEANVAVVKRCVEEGHDIASHAYRWLDYHDFPVEKEREYIKTAILSLKRLSGYAPKGWYYGRPSPQSKTLVREVYDELGEELLWYSDSYADDLPYWTDVPTKHGVKGQLIVPYSYDCNDFKFFTPGSNFSDPSSFLDHVKRAFNVLYEEGVEGSPKMMTIGLHCRIIGRPARFDALREFVEYITAKDGVWVATRTEIAEAFTKNYPYKAGQLA
ncbi:uncharacterized protein PV09_07030 [Verruconis gallopava]|uniref:NodB homology domain-containing protein n=1 Tax=Verruconis gallopava TaxID=253628 RepID=A0A0D2A433_9PEZI|nr:uncharacterized protein PV09_07030 [Verruconis gallopava]KIW01553.1 hypothetical protein PV09_07030 [Verruconis gallopava]